VSVTKYHLTPSGVAVGEKSALPFSRQIRSNRTSTGGWAKRPFKTLPLSVRTWAGTPYVRMAELNPSQIACVRSLGIRQAETQNLEWSSMPVSALAALVPLLSHAHLPPARERDKSAEVVVTNQPKV